MRNKVLWALQQAFLKKPSHCVSFDPVCVHYIISLSFLKSINWQPFFSGKSFGPQSTFSPTCLLQASDHKQILHGMKP